MGDVVYAPLVLDEECERRRRERGKGGRGEWERWR